MNKKEKQQKNKRDLYVSLRGRLLFLKSLRLRLFLIMFLIGVIPTMIIRSAILSHYEKQIISVRTAEVQTQLRVLANHLITYNYIRDSRSAVVGAELAQFSSFYDGRVLVIDDALRVIKDTYDMSAGKTIVSEDVVRCLQGGYNAVSSHYVEADHYLEVIVPVAKTRSLESGDSIGDLSDPSLSRVYGVLLASISTDSIEAMLDSLSRRSMLFQIIVSVLLFSVSMFLSEILLRPFQRLVTAFRDVQSGYSSDKVDIGDYIETRQLMDSFNQVIGRMRALDESRQDFVSNVSHELKTPMTSMKVLADSLLQQEGLPEEVYREFLTDINSELDRENNMIAELLSLARMDRRQVEMNITSVDINALLESVMKRIRPLAMERDIELVLVSERQVTAEVDESKMTSVFTNLIENAVKYNRDHGSVRVTINADHKNFVLQVADKGIGIPENARDRIFERFYRVDKSRSREIGGTGLGLALARSAVLLHKGSIGVESREGEGTTFTVTIPLIYIADPAARIRSERETEDAAHREAQE